MSSETRRRRKRSLIRRFGPTCVGCGHDFAFDALTLDHIIPASAGGSPKLTNLQLMCQPCNQAKANAVPDRIELHPWHPERVGPVGRRLEAA